MIFSIIVPTYNRPEHLDRCLAALAQLAFPRHDFEVLVVDDGSIPPPSQIVTRHASKLAIRYFQQANLGPARTRNRALREAIGDYVVFTDDDCAPSPQWLDEYHRAFDLHPGAGLGGAILDDPRNRVYGVASQMLVTYLYHYSESTGRFGFFCSNNFAFPRQDLLSLTGGFDEGFPLAAGEDRDICARWAAHRPLRFVPGAEVYHHQDLSFRSFLRQHYRYGQGAFQYWIRRQTEGGPGNTVAPLGFYTEMLTFPFARAPFLRALAISLLLALSQLACAFGYFVERRKS